MTSRHARLGLRARESTVPPSPERPAPTGVPNVLAIVLDDTGFGQLGCFGSGISTPNIDRLAAEGLRYNRFHVTSLCSPTRASFLTGRNHHAVGMGFLADLPLSFPGYTARIPKTAATLPRLLRDQGYATSAVGKWHLVPRFHRSSAGPFDYWPLGLGFERYYGFLQGDTSQWTPNLVEDNHYVDPPRSPRDGYHLSEDLVDRACRQVVDVQQAAPGKPFFLYLAFGAMHAPHHVPPEWTEPYRGRFDHGWEAEREETHRRQVTAGIIPEGTALTTRPSWVPAWSELGPEERAAHARMQEVFAGFLTHTDAQIGRLLRCLDQLELLDDTLVLLFSDNGASAEGGVVGSVNEHRFTARIRESMADNRAALADWGGFTTYNHYSWGWAWAGNAPLRLWKRYAWLGGTRTPLVIRWPRGFSARGEVRQQFCHVIDLFPTVLEACRTEVPAVVDGALQQPVDGASLGSTFDDAAASSPRSTQYFEMFGSRSIVDGRWKATTDHVPTGVLDEEELMEGSRRFEDDHWALFDVEADFSESTDLAADHPDEVGRLERLWFAEAGRNQVLPMDDSMLERVAAIVLPAHPPGPTARFLPEGGPVHDESLPFLVNGFRATAEVDVPAGPEGVLFAVGDWFGGLALFVVDRRLHFTHSHAGVVTEVVADRDLEPGEQLLSVLYAPGGAPGSPGTFSLLHGDEVVGSDPAAHEVGVALQHGGTHLRLGYDVEFPVSERYHPPARWNGGLRAVTLSTPGAPDWSADPASSVRAALHSD